MKRLLGKKYLEFKTDDKLYNDQITQYQEYLIYFKSMYDLEGIVHRATVHGITAVTWAAHRVLNASAMTIVQNNAYSLANMIRRRYEDLQARRERSSITDDTESDRLLEEC